MLLAFSKSNDSPCFVKIAIFRQKKSTPFGVLFLLQMERFECVSNMPVACSSSSAHTGRYLYQFFPVPRKGKSDASESLHLCQTRTAFLTKIATAALSGFPVPRKGKTDASESLHLRRNRIAILSVANLLFFCYHIKADYVRRKVYGLWCNRHRE